MTEPFNILITAASRRVALIRGFARAVADLGVTGSVIATDTDWMSPGLRFCDRHYIVPLSTSGDYISRTMEICAKEKIKLLIPTIDEELQIFGQHKKDFAKQGVTVLVSDETVGRVCRDKYLTAGFFNENGFPFATTWLPSEIESAKLSYPLFIKPRMGRGSVGAHPVQNETELEFFTGYVKDPVIQRFLFGGEYTIDVLAGLDGRILSVVPRERMVIRSGVCDRGKTRRDPKLIRLAADICTRLGLVGPANLQCKVDRGRATFFEINPRLSGAIQLTVAAGADFFSMIVLEALGKKPAAAIGDFEDDFLMLSYEESIFEPMNGRMSNR